MLTGAINQARPRRVASVSRSVPPPTGGWDTKHAVSDMPAENALVMDNWFPETDSVRLRSGFDVHATGIGSGAVDTLMVYNSLSGTNKLFASGNSAIYDASASGAVGAAAISGLSSVRWQWVNFGSTSTQYLFACNGVDTPRTFDGASWAASTISGPTIANLIWCNVHQRRLFVGEINSLKFWYGPVDTIGGLFASFNLSGVARLGGYIMAMGSWSRDSGAGPDDVAVFITSEGEAIVYSGIDPATAADWLLVGVYRLAPPIGRRCLTKFGADLVVITTDGFFPMSQVLPVDRGAAESVAISDQIADAVNTAARTYRSNFGWDATVYPQNHQIYFNIPIDATTSHQYVFNTLTRAPCRFTGMNANCWVIFNEQLYFGGKDGKVYLADSGQDDNGQPIVGDLVPAFSYLGDRSRLKTFQLARAVMAASSDPTPELTLNTDFQTRLGQGSISASGSAGGLWDAALWDSGVWGGSDDLYQNWVGIEGIGRAASLRVKVSTSVTEMKLLATDFVFTPGGYL